MGEEGPVYGIKPGRGKGKSSVLHRNLLLPCDYLPLEMELCTQARMKRKADGPTSVKRDDSSSEEDVKDVVTGTYLGSSISNLWEEIVS